MSKKPLPLSAKCPECKQPFTPRYPRRDRPDQVWCSRKCRDASSVNTIEEAERRFWLFVNITDGCWLWMGPKLHNGYGAFNAGKVLGKRNAHRMSWYFTHREMPERSLDVCHKCDNRLCVRPDHLFLGTRLDNMRDAKAKNRTGRLPVKLSAADVESIRQSPIANNSELARAFGVSPSLVWMIRHDKRRTSVKFVIQQK